MIILWLRIRRKVKRSIEPSEAGVGMGLRDTNATGLFTGTAANSVCLSYKRA